MSVKHILSIILKYEILFSTRFSTTFSTIFENTKSYCISTVLNNCWPQNYFYTKDLASLLHFKKKIALSAAQFFRNIRFLPHSHQFLQWMTYVIFPVNADLLVIYQNNIFTQQTLYPFFILKHHFLPHFHYF